LLKQKATATDTLVRLHQELKTKYARLQAEIESSKNSELNEAQGLLQSETDKRCSLQKQLMEALDRCDKLQKANLTLMQEKADDHSLIVELKAEVSDLKLRLDKAEDLAELGNLKSHAWIDLEQELTRLIRRTGSESNLVSSTGAIFGQGT